MPSQRLGSLPSAWLRPAGPLLLALLLAAAGGLGCHGGRGGGSAGTPPSPDLAPPPDPRLAALIQALDGEPALGLPEVQTVLAAAWLNPDTRSGFPAGPPTAESLLHGCMRPWLRPVLLDALGEALERRSTELQAARRAAHASFHYNVLILGAGPSGAVLALNLHHARPDLKLAILDRTEQPGSVFRKFGRFSWINSPETPTASSNAFPGLGVAPRDLLPAGAIQKGPYFPWPDLIADLTDLAVAESGADPWLRLEARRIRAGGGELVVETGDPDLSLTADRVVVASGLGTADRAEDDAGPAPRVESFEHLAARATRLALGNQMCSGYPGRSLMEAYAGRTVAILGAGDSANNLAEFAAGLGPPQLYGEPEDRALQPGRHNGPGIGDRGGPARVIWVRQRAADADAFKAANKGRYHGTLPQVYGRFDREPGYLQRLEAAPDGGRTLVVQDPGTPGGHATRADYVWDARGYKPYQGPVLADLAGHPRDERAWQQFLDGLEPVRAAMTVTTGPHQGQWVETTVARRLPRGRGLHEVYLAGTVAGGLATPQELRDYTLTRNAMSLNANLPRAAALALFLARPWPYRPASLPALPAAPEPRRLDPPTGEAGPTLVFTLDLDKPEGFGLTPVNLPPDPEARRHTLEVALVAAMDRAWKGFRSPRPLRARFWDFHREPGRMTGDVQVTGAEPADALTLTLALVQPPGFRALVLAYAREAHRDTLDLVVGPGRGPIRPDRISLR